MNLDFKMMGLCVASLESLESLSLNFSQNVITDIGVKMFFEEIETHPGVLTIDLDISSNSIKYEGAGYISESV